MASQMKESTVVTSRSLSKLSEARCLHNSDSQSKLLQVVRAQSHHGRENLHNALQDRPPGNRGRGQAMLLKLQLEVAVDLLLALGQEHWHALHNLLQEERLLQCVLKVFALEVFDVLRA